MIKFEPLTEEQLTQSFLIPEGCYRFKVGSYPDDCVLWSKKLADGSISESIRLNLVIDVPNQSNHRIFVYLTPKMIKLIKHFCDITGKQEKYQSKELAVQDCYPAQGWAHIKIEKSKDPAYKDKNIVFDFVTTMKASEINKSISMGNDNGMSNDLIPLSSNKYTSDDLKEMENEINQFNFDDKIPF